MTSIPHYFEPIRQKSDARWDQLEQDPELAGPWHQLFKQVQSPRHVLSELLQNADDAGATEATVRIEGGAFIFEHNGEDFTAEHFASLCRFGYSNKRSLHTIGFRGVGFKSTFSLGNRVELYSPTLSVYFDARRFTQPVWSEQGVRADGKTCIRVAIADKNRQRDIEKNLEEWLNSPVSLLFFNHIRHLKIGNKDVQWHAHGAGPVPDSEWMALNDSGNKAYLLIRSQPEAFPQDALEEIRQERMLSDGEEIDFPPTRIEIVLGAAGRLFVVLPTGVETTLPFACNAPFIQDPARMKIKDPEVSPTNRWLLRRAGALAASAMLAWLSRTDLTLDVRATAYTLLPDVHPSNGSLESTCGEIVAHALMVVAQVNKLLLTHTGNLTRVKESIIIPDTMFEVWPPEVAATLFDNEARPALTRHVRISDRQKLLHWGLIQEVNQAKVIEIMRQKQLPKPQTWRQLLTLWAYVASELTGYRRFSADFSGVQMVPVQGQDLLFAATQVARLGEKKLLQSEEDWRFLADHLLVLNQNWTNYLSELRRVAAEENNAKLQEEVSAAFDILRRIGLDTSSDFNKIVEQVAEPFFAAKSISVAGCVQLAQIAAKLGATVGESFRYVTRDRHLRPSSQDVLVDVHGELEDLLPEKYLDAHLLHPDYIRDFRSCSRDEWWEWVESGSARLSKLPALKSDTVEFKSLKKFEHHVQDIAQSWQPVYPYKTSSYYQYQSQRYYFEEFDFPADLVKHLESHHQEQKPWQTVARLLTELRPSYWQGKETAIPRQTSTGGGTSKRVQAESIPAVWVRRLRETECLPDTRGFYHKPSDLMRRTPQTEALFGVELFIDSKLDTEANRPLLDLLGVRNTPTGPDKLLDRLRSLAQASTPPLSEVEGYYRRLDQMVHTSSTADFAIIKQAFREERLILTSDGAWAVAGAVFLSSGEEDIPGAAVIRPSIADLALWRRICVAERPTIDLVLQWLKSLPARVALSPDDIRRVRPLLPRFPLQIWEECGHWLNLANEWTPTDELSYALTLQPLIPWAHLHQWLKKETADLRHLSVDISTSPPFAKLPTLASRIEDRLVGGAQVAGRVQRKEWLATLGKELCRIVLDDEEEMTRIRELASDLAETTWQSAAGLETIPYIDGMPAGTPRGADVVWADRVLHVGIFPQAKLAKLVPDEIAKAFVRLDIKAALDYSFERSPEAVREYLEENFNLESRQEVAVVFHSEAKAQHERNGTLPDIQKSDLRREQKEDDILLDEVDEIDEADEVIDLDELIALGEAAMLEDDANRFDLDEEDSASEETANEESEEEPTNTAHEDVTQRTPPKSKPPTLSIIERFTLINGFVKNGDGRFHHLDGRWIGRSQDGRAFWDLYSADGGLIRTYMAKDHCLEQTPLQIEADFWALLDKFPHHYGLILVDAEDNPVEVTGTHLRTLQAERKITLYPATYRLVYGDTHGQL